MAHAEAAVRLAESLAACCVRRPWTVLAVALAGSLLCLGYAATHLTLKTSNLDLIDPELPPVAHFRDFAAEFGTPNVLIVVFEGDDPAALEAAVDRVAPRLAAAPGVRGVVDRVPLDRDALAILGIEPYFTSRDRGLCFVFVQPDDPTSSAATLAPFVAGARRVLAAADLASLGVRAGLTGMPAYALDDRDVIQRDIALLSFVSLLLILLLFATAFSSLRQPVMVGVALLVSVALLLGVTAVVPGHLTLLSAFFASILFALGVDIGIHLLGRVEELTAQGLPSTRAIPRAVGALARPLTTGALTSASVLFAMQLSGFKGFAELGVIAGTGVLISLAVGVSVLPALWVLAAAPPPRPRKRRIGRVLLALQSRPLAGSLVAAAVLGAVFGGPGFDTDYLNLQPRGSEAVRLEREMIRRSGFSPEVAVFTAESLEEVADLTWELVNDDTVGAVRSLRDLMLAPGLPGALPDLPEAFLAGLRSPAGRYAVYAYPKEDVWEPRAQAELVAHMRAIDERVTGMPLLGSFMVERSQRALAITAALGSVLLLFWVFADFRRLAPALAAVLPTALTALSLHALLRLAGIPFNPLNVMALPVVLGIAVDDGVHVVHRFLAERGDLERTLDGVGRSVVLTSATTLAAFGTLAFTSHRGLASFAIALSLGVAAASVFSLLVLPQLLTAFAPRLLAPASTVPRRFAR